MKVLVIAPHPDDEILGCGGTIAKRVLQGHDVYVCIATKGVEPIFDQEGVEQVRSECREADRSIGVKETIFLDFPAAMLETVPRYQLNNRISEVIQTLRPDEVFIPHRGDVQHDHKFVVDASMVALRPRNNNIVSRVYAYETLSETGWDIPKAENEFMPNMYEDISATLSNKIAAMEIFKSQIADFPNARSIQAITALAQFRGAMVSSQAAEAFMLIRGINK